MLTKIRNNIMLVLILTVLFLPMSCGPSEKIAGEGGDRKITLEVWSTYNEEEHDVFMELLNKFEKNNETLLGQKFKINVRRVPFNGLLSRLKTAAMARTTPDIARIDIGALPDLAFSNAVVRLDKLRNFPADSLAELREKFLPGPIGTNIIEIGGEAGLYGLPDQVTTVCLFWNKDLFRQRSEALLEAGLDPDRAPRTWEEFIEYGKILNQPDKNIYGFGMRKHLWWTMPFFNTYGAKILGREGEKWEYKLDSQKAINALKLKVSLTQKYGFEAGAWRPGSVTPGQGFINERYAMILTGPWQVKKFQNAGINFGVSLIPAGPNDSSSNVGGTNMVVFRDSRHPKAALELLKYITSIKYQLQWSKSLKQIPVRVKAVDRRLGEASDILATFMKQAKLAAPRPSIPNWSIVHDEITKQLSLALSGAKTPKAALTDAGASVRKRVLNELNESKKD